MLLLKKGYSYKIKVSLKGLHYSLDPIRTEDIRMFSTRNRYLTAPELAAWEWDIPVCTDTMWGCSGQPAAEFTRKRLGNWKERLQRMHRLCLVNWWVQIWGVLMQAKNIQSAQMQLSLKDDRCLPNSRPSGGSKSQSAKTVERHRIVKQLLLKSDFLSCFLGK